jgi:hypothetical protein
MRELANGQPLVSAPRIAWDTVFANDGSQTPQTGLLQGGQYAYYFFESNNYIPFTSEYSHIDGVP